jgi:hypothetical protein
MSRPSKRRLSLALVGLAALVPFAASLAFADAVDPSMPRSIVVGSPRGFAPSERLDSHRTGRSSTRLPYPPVEVWRRHISGGIEVAPLIDPHGGILLPLTVPEVLKLGPDGKELWRARLGTAAPLAPPVLTSDGTLALITSAGQAFGITPSGAIRFAVPLGIRGRDADTAPLALDDGGLVVAAGRTLLELAADGAVRARTQIEDRIVGALLAGPEGTLVTTESGGVYTWRPPGAPRKIGSFGGAPRRGAALADARTLIGVIEGRRVVALDLPTGTTHVRSSGSGGVSAFDAPVAIAPGGIAVASTQAGLLVGIDAAGNEKLHVSLDKIAPAAAGDASPMGGFFGAIELKPSPAVIIDPDGRIGFARAGGRVGVVGTDGAVAVAGEKLCSVPVAVQPAGPRRMLVACRDGAIWMLGE